MSAPRRERVVRLAILLVHSFFARGGRPQELKRKQAAFAGRLDSLIYDRNVSHTPVSGLASRRDIEIEPFVFVLVLMLLLVLSCFFLSLFHPLSLSRGSSKPLDRVSNSVFHSSIRTQMQTSAGLLAQCPTDLILDAVNLADQIQCILH